MGGGSDLNKQFEALKRQATDLVREMHARKLAIPAAALLGAIVAAMVLLPQAASPPPPPPTATAPVAKAAVARVAQVSLVKPSSLDEDIPLTSSSDPFTGTTGYSCKQISSKPKTYDCLVADLTVRIVCSTEAGAGPCAPKPAGGGSTGSAGGSEGTGGSGGEELIPVPSPDSGNGNSNGGGSDTPKGSVYEVTVSIDGSTKKHVIAGDELPNQSNPLAIYAGTNNSHDKAVFIAADGVTVTGVAVDQTFGSFMLRTGDTATLKDALGAEHKMTLKSISKVTK